jgi:Meiotically up-regulated gene 113
MEKAHILQEIKRTATENGGVPLGMGRFEKETGIKVEDCVGRHWARWNDALREAGFSPNQMNAAYDESFLFEKYIELAREIGRLPVKAEIQLKTKSSSGFPTTHAFRRFGSKKEFVAKLKEYCEKHTGHQDVMQMCERYTPRGNDESEAEPSDGDVGFVYLMKSGKFYKVGRSNAAGRREYELGIQLPEKLKSLHVIRTDDPTGIEAYWHSRFAAKRKNGEWFELDPADVSAFKRRKFM